MIRPIDDQPRATDEATRQEARSVARSGDSDGHETTLGEFLEQLRPAWFQSLGPEARPTVRSIGRFEVIRLLGSGGFGDVLLVHDPRLDRNRAMKVPRLESIEVGSTRLKFFREARATASLDHPNVVRVFEADEVGPVCYLIMEYCEAGSLASWLASRPSDSPLPARWTAEFVASLADGVAHAHARGLLHRDLKPSNVLLVEEPGEPVEGLPRFVPKVADFGLAKFLAEAVGYLRTASDALVGTLAYMAPEQARRNPAGITARTDVYGLGAILFEMLAGRRPFVGLDQAHLVDEILHREPGTPRAGLPADLETICRKCLAKDPGDRYASAAELADDLRRWLRGDPIRARRSPAWKMVRAWARRHPIRVATVGLAALGIVGVATWHEARERQAAASWLERLGVANPSGLADLVVERRANDPRVAAEVGRMFAEGTADQKLVAAVFLARARPECAEHAVGRLLEAQAGIIGPLARALAIRLPDLRPRLEAVVAGATSGGPASEGREALDRRRSKAATALILLGDREAGWRLLRFAPDPQVRSFLIHDLGPSGVEPETILRRLENEPDPSTRRALILALGEIPDARWPGEARSRASAKLLSLYRDDADRGVHGASKWLLGRWGLRRDRDDADRELAGRPEADPPAEWRVSKSLLTFATVPHPERGRLIEVLDTEVTREFFSRLFPEHKHDLDLSPDLECPANTITYHDAAAFCERLNVDENFPASYRRSVGPKGEPVYQALPGNLDRPGYRLVTLEESIVACRSGTTSLRFFGDSASLLDSYAWARAPGRTLMFPVGLLKPNDYGLFDLIGNAVEIGQSVTCPNGEKNQSVLYGGSVTSSHPSLRWDYFTDGFRMNQRSGAGLFGFRIVRTRAALPGLEPHRPAPGG